MTTKTELTLNSYGVQIMNYCLMINGSKSRAVKGDKVIEVEGAKAPSYMIECDYAVEFTLYSYDEFCESQQAVMLSKHCFQEYDRRWLKPFACVVALSDWLGQQNETLKDCYKKRLNMWGVM